MHGRLPFSVDAGALEADLRRSVRGDVRFDAGNRALYSTDASNYRQVALGIVLPKDAQDVEATIAACRRHDAPILSRGGGTSLAGQTCNAAVVIDFSKYMNRICEIDWTAKTARVEPGCVTDDLRDAAETRHLTFGPDPATHNRNTMGGMIGNNSCGMHAQMAGKVEANIEHLDIVTYGGLRMSVGRTTDEQLAEIIAHGGQRSEIYAQLKALRDRYADEIRARFPKIPRRVSGYSLDQLLPENGFNVARALVGSEGTCVTVLEATCRLVHSPPCRTLAVFGFDDIAMAADHVPFCNAHHPIALEGLDESMFTYMHDKGMSTEGRALFPSGAAWLIVEFGGDTVVEANERAEALVADFQSQKRAPSWKVINDRAEERCLWEVRESGLGSTSKIPNLPDFYPGWEDSAVDPSRLGAYLREFQGLLRRYGYHASLYGHFGQGCLHCSIDFDLFTAAGIANYRAFVTEAAHMVVRFGGSLSGEHGDGQARGELLPIMFGDGLVNAFWEFKRIWDPADKMNPGKVSRPYRLDENLRWGVDYSPPQPATHFTFPDDHGSFAFAANRCVGTGKCRKHDSGTMCPSYMATKEEAYSTRGRARLLFEMLRGDPIGDGWGSESVKDALEYCLSCKGCKSECPVNVDMATYKAEFLAHYYERKRRPMGAYAFALMPRWSQIASFAPNVANAVSQAPGLQGLLKAAIAVAPQRRLPLLASRSFRAWFAARPKHNAERSEVVLWPDTWNNYFHPATAQAAVEVLEDAGYRVTIPRVALCCGRPLYDYGMLDVAKRWLQRALEELRPLIRAGVPVIGLEPSCVSVFREEMVNLLGDDEDAKRLKLQTFLLTEFLARKTEYRPPPLARHALVHQHCHHKSVLDKSAEAELYDRMQLDYTIPDSGCCGMAGPFGFEAKHYAVSMAIGERVLLPRVRDCSAHTIVVADGFSCREQIAQATKRQALHPAQLLKMAIDDRGAERDDALPERRYMPDPGAERARASRNALITGAGMLLTASVLRAAWRRSR